LPVARASRLPAANNPPLRTNNKPQTTNNKPQTTNYKLKPCNTCQLPKNSRLPAAKQPAIANQPQTTNNKQQTTIAYRSSGWEKKFTVPAGQQ
jgi:hypothetical protein